MLYVLTQTPGLSSLGWSPTGFHTTWTTHRQNGDNLIYSSCTLGTYRGRFCIVWADKGKRGYPRCEEFPRLHRENSGVCPWFTRITNAHTHTHMRICAQMHSSAPLTHKHTHTHTHKHTHTSIHTLTQTHIHTHMHTCAHIQSTFHMCILYRLSTCIIQCFSSLPLQVFLLLRGQGWISFQAS